MYSISLTRVLYLYLLNTFTCFILIDFQETQTEMPPEASIHYRMCTERECYVVVRQSLGTETRSLFAIAVSSGWMYLLTKKDCITG